MRGLPSTESMAYLPFYQRKVAGKANHAMNLMNSLEKMKKKDFLCDFTIIVGDWSFPVHRTVLAACSGYFEAMYSSEMREVREGFVNMKGLEPCAVDKCIEFMYSGDIVITSDEVENILHASNLIQLEELTDRCLKFLESNLSVDNCLFVVNISRLYGRKDITEKAIEYARENFEDLVLTEMFAFVSASDLAHYVTCSNCNYVVLWKAIISWLTHNGDDNTENFKQVVSVVNPDVFPFDFLFSTALNELTSQNFNRGVELLLDNIFSDVQALESNLNRDNCFQLHQLNRSRKNTCSAVSANKVIIKFWAKNLESVSEKKEFLNLQKSDVLEIFRSSQNCMINRQETIWSATKRWVKHILSRAEDLPELFLALKLDYLPCNFIRNSLRPAGLVSESKLCKMRILQTVSRRVSHIDPEGKYNVPCIAMLNSEICKIQTLEVQCEKWSDLHQCLGEDLRRIASINGRLYVLGEKLFVLEPDGLWREGTPLKRKPCPWCQLTTHCGSLFVVEGKSMARYDPKRDEWTENLPGCGLLMGFFIASDGSKCIYAMGGNSAEKFDATTRKWSAIAPMRIQRYDAAAAILDGLLYVMGGTQFGKLFKSVECYNPQTDNWTDFVSMCEPRSHFSACVVGVANRLYAVGGSKQEDGLDQSENGSVEMYDPNDGEWQVVARMKTTGGRTLATSFELDIADIVRLLRALPVKPNALDDV